MSDEGSEEVGGTCLEVTQPQLTLACADEDEGEEVNTMRYDEDEGERR
jgi:hypothetical protein